MLKATCHVSTVTCLNSCPTGTIWSCRCLGSPLLFAGHLLSSPSHLLDWLGIHSSSSSYPHRTGDQSLSPRILDLLLTSVKSTFFFFNPKKGRKGKKGHVILINLFSRPPLMGQPQSRIFKYIELQIQSQFNRTFGSKRKF